MTDAGSEVRSDTLTKRSFSAIGTTATVVVQDAAGADRAERMLADDLGALDLACSRFRSDSELEALHAQSGRTVPVGELLFDVLRVAVEVAERTGGAVDPTVGNAISALGYDADFDEVVARPPALERARDRASPPRGCPARWSARGSSRSG